MPKAKEPTTELVVTAEQLLGHPYDRDWVIQEARQSLADHNQSGIQLGLCLIALRQQEEHGNYDKALKRIGLPRSTAHRYARRAEWIMENHEQFKCPNLGHLTGGKLDELIKLPATTLAEVLDDDGNIAGHAIDEIERMTSKEFKSVLSRIAGDIGDLTGDISDMETALARSQTHNEKLEGDVRNLKKRLAERTHPGPLPEYVEEIRISSATWAEEGIDVIARMDGLLSKLNRPEDGLSTSDPDRETLYSVAATSFLVNLRSLYLTVHNLVEQAERDLDGVLIDKMELPPLTSEQLRHFEADRKHMLTTHDGTELITKAQTADKVGKRGRRPGTKMPRKKQ